MDQYLTAKAQKARWWEIPAVAFSGLLGIVGVNACIETFDSQEPLVWLTASLLVMGIILLPLFFALRARLRRGTARKIAKALARRREPSVPLAELDKLTGVRDAEIKIRKLTNKGFLQYILLDEKNYCAWLDTAGIDAPKPAPVPEPVPAEPEDEYARTLREIRRLNDEIADEAVSARIDQLEVVTAGVFSVIREQPEKADAARKLLNYYLPTTLKLLESYSLLERQSYQGENIRGARREIEGILEKLVYAVEQQHDRLFRADALDIEAEIRALDTMLQVDGLGKR